MTTDLDALADLEEQRDFLLRSLRDLDRERVAGDIDEADYAALRDDYTARAAAVLRAIEAERADLPPAAPPARRRSRAVAWVAGVTALALVAGFLVAGSAGERVAGRPATGSVRDTTSARLDRAQRLAGRGEALAAIRLYDAILRDDPENLEALVYRGWITRLAGQSAEGRAAGLPERGLEYVERALAVDPDYPVARLFRAVILFRDLDRPAEAVADLERFLASDPPPEMAAMAESVLAEARAAAASAP